MHSIITNILDICIECGNRLGVERHHIFGASERDKSTEYGLIAPLCHDCHRIHRDAVHQNYEKSLRLKRLAQMCFEQEYPEFDFERIFGQNFL